MEATTGIKKRLWSSADNLRSNSNYASNEYFLPVMGLILPAPRSQPLRAGEGAQVEPTSPQRGGRARALCKPGLAPKEVSRIKAVAQELLEALKAEKLRVDRWRDKQATRDAVRVGDPRLPLRRAHGPATGSIYR